MAVRILTLAALICATLCGCGGGGGSAPSDEQAAGCTPVGVVTIQLFGDSTQYGYDGATHATATTTPGTALQAAMDARFGVGAVRVLDQGRLGTTSAQLLTGSDTGLAWPRPVSGHIVVINHGINDALTATPISTYKTNLRALSAAPATVFLETPNPLHGRPVETDTYAQAMREVASAQGVGLIDTAAFVRRQADWQALVPDGIHPVAEMYARIGAGPLADAVSPTVAQLKCQ